MRPVQCSQPGSVAVNPGGIAINPKGGGQRGQPERVAVNSGQHGAGHPGQCGRCRNGEPSWQPGDCAREKVERALAKAAGAIGCMLTRSGMSTSWSREECQRSFGKEG